MRDPAPLFLFRRRERFPELHHPNIWLFVLLGDNWPILLPGLIFFHSWGTIDKGIIYKYL